MFLVSQGASATRSWENSRIFRYGLPIDFLSKGEKITAIQNRVKHTILETASNHSYNQYQQTSTRTGKEKKKNREIEREFVKRNKERVIEIERDEVPYLWNCFTPTIFQDDRGSLAPEFRVFFTCCFFENIRGFFLCVVDNRNHQFFLWLVLYIK